MDDVDQVLAGRKAALGVTNRGLDDRVETEPAVTFFSVAPALQRAGHADRPVADQVFTVRRLHVVGPCIRDRLVHVRRRRMGRDRVVVDVDELVVRGIVEVDEASIAFPPIASISRPAADPSGWLVDTMPLVATASCL